MKIHDKKKKPQQQQLLKIVVGLGFFLFVCLVFCFLGFFNPGPLDLK